jgi:hypothetical protein
LNSFSVIAVGFNDGQVFAQPAAAPKMRIDVVTDPRRLLSEVTRLLTHQHQGRVRQTFAWHRLHSVLIKLAALKTRFWLCKCPEAFAVLQSGDL